MAHYPKSPTDVLFSALNSLKNESHGKAKNFIRKLNGIKGAAFKVRIRQRYPLTGENFKISKSLKTRKQTETYKKITITQILEGALNQNKKGELSN